MSTPSISLCMIVKNEARHLEECLASVADLVQEILIGDTGSADDTPQIANRLGAQVFEISWRNDFAAARNAVLAHASADWVMILDADCRILPATRVQIPAVLHQPVFAGPVILNAQFISPQHDPIYSRFLFRQGYGMKFTGRVHETLDAPEEIPLRRYHCPQLLIQHEPCTPEAYRAKQESYLKLLLEELAEPELSLFAQVRLWKHLGDAYLAGDCAREAYLAFCESWKRLQYLEIKEQDLFASYLIYQIEGLASSLDALASEDLRQS